MVRVKEQRQIRQRDRPVERELARRVPYLNHSRTTLRRGATDAKFKRLQEDGFRLRFTDLRPCRTNFLKFFLALNFLATIHDPSRRARRLGGVLHAALSLAGSKGKLDGIAFELEAFGERF